MLSFPFAQGLFGGEAALDGTPAKQQVLHPTLMREFDTHDIEHYTYAKFLDYVCLFLLALTIVDRASGLGFGEYLPLRIGVIILRKICDLCTVIGEGQSGRALCAGANPETKPYLIHYLYHYAGHFPLQADSIDSKSLEDFACMCIRSLIVFLYSAHLFSDNGFKVSNLILVPGGSPMQTTFLRQNHIHLGQVNLCRATQLSCQLTAG